MVYLIVLFLFMVAVYLTYNISIYRKYGILPSVSASYYSLPKKWNLLFTLFTWGYALPAMIIGVDLTHNVLMFLAGGGITFVGAAAAYKEELTEKVHVYGAWIGIGATQLSIIFDFHMWYVSAVSIGLGGLLYLLKIKNLTYWVEQIAFISITYVLGLNIYQIIQAM